MSVVVSDSETNLSFRLQEHQRYLLEKLSWSVRFTLNFFGDI